MNFQTSFGASTGELLAKVSLFFGIVGLLFSEDPIIGVPLGIVGVVTGIVGVRSSITKKLAWIGIVLSVLALISSTYASIFMTVATHNVTPVQVSSSQHKIG